MLLRHWYKLYLFVLAAVGLIAILPGFIGDTPETPTALSSSVESLNFYSASVPLESRLAVYNWLKLNNVADTSLHNITPQAGTLRDTSYRFRGSLTREVSLYMDIKNPKVSYKVNIATDPYGKVNSLTTIGCPEPQQQRGSATKCQEMLAP